MRGEALDSPMMNSLLHLVLANVLVAGLLAVVAWLVGRHSRRPALVHTLWLLVLVKLVTPPIVKLPVHWPTSGSPPEPTALKEIPQPPRKTQPPDRVVLLALEPEPPQRGLLSAVLPVLLTATRDPGPGKISPPSATNSKPEENPSSPAPGTYALVPLAGGGFQATPIEVAFDAVEVIETEPIELWELSGPWMVIQGTLSPVQFVGGAVFVPHKTSKPSGATSSTTLAN